MTAELPPEIEKLPPEIEEQLRKAMREGVYFKHKSRRNARMGAQGRIIGWRPGDVPNALADAIIRYVTEKSVLELDGHLYVIRPMRGDETPERAHHLLGKVVRVRMSGADVQGAPSIALGKLLGFGQDGEFEILDEDGTVHYCWPMLGIEEEDGQQ